MATINWTITGKEILTFWTDIWPRIVALAWWDELKGEQPSYRCVFEGEERFRVDEAQRIARIIGVHYESDIPICVTTLQEFDIKLEVDSSEYFLATKRGLLRSIRQGLLDNQIGLADRINEKGVIVGEDGKEIQEVIVKGDDGDPLNVIRELLQQIREALLHVPIENIENIENVITEEGILVTPPTNTTPVQPMCQSGLYGETYFRINNNGFIMPWPKMPDREEVFIGYWQGGGVLPRLNPLWKSLKAGTAALIAPLPANTGPPLPPDPVTGPRLADRDFTILEQIKAWAKPDKCPPLKPCLELRGLSGVSLITLIEKWPKVVSLAWNNPATNSSSCPGANPISDVVDKIKNDLQAHIMPEVWSTWPYDLRESAGNATSDDITLSHTGGNKPGWPLDIDLEVPVPTDIPTTEDIFEELIIGHASNPMYSNCY